MPLLPGNWTFYQIALAAVISSCVTVLAEDIPSSPALRIAREDSSSMTCVLLEDSGAFHYETGDRRHTRVYEGQIKPGKLREITRRIESLSQLSQQQIEEPLVPSSLDLLDIHIFRNGTTKELLFQSPESQQLQAELITPVLRWMYALPSVPHRTLSEDAGKRNCLPRRKLALRSREDAASTPPLFRLPTGKRRSAPTLKSPTTPAVDAAVVPLMQLNLLEKGSSTVQQECALVASDGHYRFESRYQKLGRTTIMNRLSRGQLAMDDLQLLRRHLDQRAISSLGHKEPPGGMELNIMGTVLELYIARGSHEQELILTDSRHRTTFFFPGDGDISVAKPVMDFVQKSMESGSQPADSTSLNGCSQLP